MPFDAFLKLAGIEGESTDAAHEKWIEILSFSHGISQMKGGSVSATGAHAGQRADFTDFSIVKTLDKTSPKLALACADGTHFTDATIEICKAGGDKQKYMEYKLSDVLVSSFRPGGSAQGGDALPLEEVSLAYAKINWTYTVIDKAGKPAGNVPAGWDLAANKKI